MRECRDSISVSSERSNDVYLEESCHLRCLACLTMPEGSSH